MRTANLSAEAIRRDPAGLRKLLVILLPILAALLGASCAKIGEPQPPQVRIPLAAADVAARQQSDSIVITFSSPERNINGTEATTLRRVDILRVSEEAAQRAAGPLDEKQFISRAARILAIPSNQFSEYRNGKVFVVQDRAFPEKSGMYSHTFRYAVLFVNNKNQSAGLSNQALITPVPIPLAPSGLSAKGSQNSIRLSWSAPSENMDGSQPPLIAGYNVYRSDERGKFPPEPLNQAPIRTTEFEDLNFRFDTTYYYAVSTVGGPDAESQLSGSLLFDSKDVYPPDPPKDFSAILEDGSVLLVWESSPSEDVAGYRIYRVEKGTSIRRNLQSELIRSISYRDGTIEPGKDYSYEIRAVDMHGNEASALTAEVEKR